MAVQADHGGAAWLSAQVLHHGLADATTGPITRARKPSGNDARFGLWASIGVGAGEGAGFMVIYKPIQVRVTTVQNQGGKGR